MNCNHIVSNNNVDICDLRKKYGIIDDYVKNTLPSHGKCRFFVRDVPEKDKQKMINMYLDGYNSYTIGDVFDMSYKQIIVVLEEYGVSRMYSGGTRKYSLNEHYFDVIDNQNKAYILGLLFADGWNDDKTNVISISLEESDKDILVKVKNELGFGGDLYYIDYSDSKERYGRNMRNQYRLNIRSYIMTKALEKIGCANRKSLKLEFPIIPIDLYPHFIRGYFDGDGSLYISRPLNRNTINYYFNLISTYSFLDHIRNYLINTLSISCGGIYPHRTTKGVYVLTVCGKKQTCTIMDLLYKNAELFLDRKHKRYLDYYYNDNSLTM